MNNVAKEMAKNPNLKTIDFLFANNNTLNAINAIMSNMIDNAMVMPPS